MEKIFNGVFEKGMNHPRLTLEASSFKIKFSSISFGKNMLPQKGDILMLVVQIPMYNKIKHRCNYLFKVCSLILWEPMVKGPYTWPLPIMSLFEKEQIAQHWLQPISVGLVYRPMLGIDIGSKDLTSVVRFF